MIYHIKLEFMFVERFVKVQGFGRVGAEQKEDDMSASAYFWGAALMVLGLVAILAAVGPFMPHEPAMVVAALGSVVGIIGAIVFFNEICYAATGRSLFG